MSGRLVSRPPVSGVRCQVPGAGIAGGRGAAAYVVLVAGCLGGWLAWPGDGVEANDTSFRRFGHRAGMVMVPTGWFIRGSSRRGTDEFPEHRVYLDGFYIDRYEVTQSEYDRCVEAGVCRQNTKFDGEGGPRQPVVGVTWTDATTYCRWVGKRLPTEAEWEKAARGEDGRLYPWGSGLTCSDANYGNGHNNECPTNPGRTADVGSYPRDVSVYGVYDMAGNVWEHVADVYDSEYYRRAPKRNPQGPTSGQHRVLKGGSWYTTANNLVLSARIGRRATPNRYDGFRCARDMGR